MGQQDKLNSFSDTFLKNDGDIRDASIQLRHLSGLNVTSKITLAMANAAAAIVSASNAQSTADSKIVTFIQTDPPTAGTTGDLWIDSNDGNKLYRWNGSSWVAIQDTGIADALTAASNAQSTADGKIVTFRQGSVPVATDVGDLWIDTDDNKIYRATNIGDDEIASGQWELQNAAIATGWSHSSDSTKIDGGNIYTGTVTAEKITVTDLDELTSSTGDLTVGGSSVVIEGSTESIKIFGDSMTVTLDYNDDLDWIENSTTYAAVLASGVYSPTNLAAEAQSKMRAAGDDNTNVTYSATTRKITIANSSLSTLTLKWNSGTHTATSCGKILGFNISADDTGALTYTADYQTALRVELGLLA
jgi:hypothetical protein